MHVKLILPALAEAESPFWRPIKYSLFPPLGLATLAAYLPTDWRVDLQDQHVETLDLEDTPDLVIIQVYITNAYRAYRIADAYRAKGCYVCLGGLHVTSLPDEATPHADSIFLGPGEETFPQFLTDWQAGRQKKVYFSEELKEGYDWAYREFYSWRSIASASLVHESAKHKLKHFLYAGGWKKFEPLWNVLIKSSQLNNMLPLLEAILAKVRTAAAATPVEEDTAAIVLKE